MKFEKIKEVFDKNNNKWMTSIEVFNKFNENEYAWTQNARGMQGHKNIISRDLSERYRSKFEIDKSTRPQKYRLKNFDYNKRSNIKEINKEVNVDTFFGGKKKDEEVEVDVECNKLVENREDTLCEFILDVNNLKFEEYSMPIEEKRRSEKKSRRNIPRKFDYEKRTKRNKNKGDLGEEVVVFMEKSNLIALGREDLAESVIWASKEIGDGLGYDIESWRMVEEKFQKIYIEVKTTTGDIYTPFDISAKEVSVSKELGDRYYIYRLFGVKQVTSKINYYIINGDITNKFNLKPTSFMAYLKTD